MDLQIQQIFYHNIHSYNDSNQLFHLFPWYEQRGIYIERLMIKGSPMAATWGYILSLVFIFLLIWKIAIYRHFPSSNKAKLISYYKSLINSNINVLTEYLQTYHWKK